MGFLKKEYGKKLAFRREQLGFSQKELADKIGSDGSDIDQSRVSKWENGTEPSLKWKKRLYEALQIDESYFTEPIPEPEPINAQSVAAYIKGLEESNKQLQARVSELERQVPPIDPEDIYANLLIVIESQKEQIKTLKAQLELKHNDKTREKYRRGKAR